MIQILYPQFIGRDLARSLFFEKSNQSGWVKQRTSMESGISPEYFSRAPLDVLFDWGESDAQEFRRLWSKYAIVLNLDEEEEDEIYARINSRSVDLTSQVV